MSTNRRLRAAGIVPPAPRGPRAENAPRGGTHDSRPRRQRTRGQAKRAALTAQH